MSTEYDSAVSEIHDEMYRREEERKKSSFNGFDQKTKFWIGISGAALALLIIYDKVTMQKGLMIGAIGAVILLILGHNNGRKELTNIECLVRLNDQLKFLQKHPIGDKPQIPLGKIHVTPKGKKQWVDGQAWKRSYGVEIYDEHQKVTEIYLIEVDIFTADIISYIHRQEGVTGDEKKDIKFLPPPDMLIQKKRDQYLGKTFSYGRR